MAAPLLAEIILSAFSWRLAFAVLGAAALQWNLYMGFFSFYTATAFGLFVRTDKKGNQNCMVIGRSDHDGLDVGALMKSLGGGGHPGAGSAMLKGANPETVEAMIVDLIQGNQQSSAQISDLMSFPVVTLPDSTSMREAAVVLREKGCTGLPVTNAQGRIIGMLSAIDNIHHWHRHFPTFDRHPISLTDIFI